MAIEPTTDALLPPAEAPDDASQRPLPACPLCGAQLQILSERCQSCGGGLLALLRVAELADVYFNRAIVAGRERKWWQAAEDLAVTLALRPDDVEALVLLGKVRLHQRQREGRELAVAAWEQALRLAPDRADVKLAIELVTRSPRSRARRKNPRRR